MRTKAEILTAKRDFLAAELAKAEREIDGLKGTECKLNCAGCGEFLATEWDFASHFIIPDEFYLNLGSCPVTDKPYTRQGSKIAYEITRRIL